MWTTRVPELFSQQTSCTADWKSLLDAPLAHSKAWLLKQASVSEVSHLFPATTVSGESVQVIAVVLAGDVDKVVKASGKLGVVSRAYVVKGEESSQFKKVPLATEHDNAAALRIAESVSAKAWGLWPMGAGWCVRVKPADFEEVLKELRPEDYEKFIGSDFIVKGLPMDWGATAVAKFLAPWDAHAIVRYSKVVGFSKHWFVRSKKEPPTESLSTRTQWD